MAALQAEHVRASFLFADDLKSNHQDWLGSTTIGIVMEFRADFATVSGRDLLVVGQTHTRSGTLNLLITDVPFI